MRNTNQYTKEQEEYEIEKQGKVLLPQEPQEEYTLARSVPETPMEGIWSLSIKTDLAILERSINGKMAHILLDNGATECFVSTKFIGTHKITPERLDTPETVSVTNGKILDITEQASLSFNSTPSYGKTGLETRPPHQLENGNLYHSLPRSNGNSAASEDRKHHDRKHPDDIASPTKETVQSRGRSIPAACAPNLGRRYQ
ncbi:hypothetical protein INT44_007596 [Umbelopsis vinacea]|uniref:Uncharacterized protein n=1 Tax=Umbelopsis vinacea TaxID=44442 RepID=A0A8H7UCR5_9FUNG|nr:hypothetical protein INT44_007596 [Umbelopsis vinacea]